MKITDAQLSKQTQLNNQNCSTRKINPKLKDQQSSIVEEYNTTPSSLDHFHS